MGFENVDPYEQLPSPIPLNDYFTAFVDMNENIRVPISDADADEEMASSNSHPLVERTQSNSSHYSDCNSDITSDEYDYDDYYKEKVSNIFIFFKVTEGRRSRDLDQSY